MTTALPETSPLLVDTNMLVLFAVGRVNRGRIETFKRTRKFASRDFDLLLRVLGRWRTGTLYTVPHVLAEVSNLTDLIRIGRPANKTVSERNNFSSIRSQDPER